MQTLSPLDASFLHIEDAATHMHIGSVGIFEGPPPGPGEVKQAIAERLPLVPRYRQKVRFVPFALGRPAWVDDPHFNLDYHVRRTALPSPGGDEELRNLVGRVMSQQLDRTKPLWELWVAEGLGDGRWALISKSHHCMVDGVSATDLLSVILSKERQPESRPAPEWRPDPEPGAPELIAHALALRALSPYEATRTLLSAARGPRRAARKAVDTTRGLVNFRSLLTPNPASSLNGPVGPHRRWDWARARLSDIKEIRAEHGGTINDVVLAVIAGGFRELLLSRGEDVEGRFIRTLVPVSVRTEDERGTYNNKVSAMFAELPICLDDPVDRLRSVHEQMQELKQSGQAVAAERLTALSGFAPAMLLALSGRVGTRLPQASVNTVTTNVPGPQQPLYLVGRRMLEAFPFVPLGGHVRVGVAIFSYDGGINFGATGDADTAPDIAVLCRGIERSVGELRRKPPSPPAERVDGPSAESARGRSRRPGNRSGKAGAAAASSRRRGSSQVELPKQ
ncbi:MAG: wax ester/triacylglycerol synthase family O-acyltransferase [Solirubrobacterales bacterium]|nr:wax ester/triacylglycerol synthase family O-acyltransferase [Solirubrobacterales bacterium]MBV9716989.1 wax ester/triacylglycerol synthase family O-acyltransferase [Solirubrobacterales bacterium]